MKIGINIPFGDQKDLFYKKQAFTTGIRSCDMLITRGYDFIGENIRKVTNACVNHVALVVKDGMIIEAQFSGIKLVPFSNYVKNDDGVLIIRNLALSEEQKSSIMSYCYMKAAEKEGYDYLGALKFLFSGFKNSSNEEFCSELMVNGFAHGQERISNDPSQVSSPGDLLDYQYLYGGLHNVPLDGSAIAIPYNGWILADYKNIDIRRVMSFENAKLSL